MITPPEPRPTLPGRSGARGLPERIGSCRVEACLGEGSYAVVYRAIQEGLDREVAVKVLHPMLAADPEFRGRFEREARTIAALAHPNIVPVHDCGETEDGRAYIVMGSIRGGTLQERLREGRPFEAEEIVALARQIGGALDHAHANGLVHRDVKPENILLDGEGRYLLSDFGVAKIVQGDPNRTLPGKTFGSPPYMSPEQCRGDASLDGRSDLYSLGVILYELFVGEVPFRAETPSATMLKHVREEARIPTDHLDVVGAPLRAVILTALAKDAADRFESGAEMAEALEAALDHPEATAPALAPRRRRAVFVPVILLALLGILAVGVLAGTSTSSDMSVLGTETDGTDDRESSARGGPAILGPDWTGTVAVDEEGNLDVLTVLVRGGALRRSSDGRRQAFRDLIVAPLRDGLGPAFPISTPADDHLPLGAFENEAEWIAACSQLGAELVLVLDVETRDPGRMLTRVGTVWQPTFDVVVHYVSDRTAGYREPIRRTFRPSTPQADLDAAVRAALVEGGAAFVERVKTRLLDLHEEIHRRGRSYQVGVAGDIPDELVGPLRKHLEKVFERLASGAVEAPESYHGPGEMRLEGVVSRTTLPVDLADDERLLLWEFRSRRDLDLVRDAVRHNLETALDGGGYAVELVAHDHVRLFRLSR